MSESQHPESIWNDPRITAFALGDLSADEVVKFESEMAASPELAAAVEEASVLTSQLKSHFASETTPRLDPGRRSEILARSTPQPGKLGNNRPWWKRRWAELAVAASLIFIVIGLAWPTTTAHRVSSLSIQTPTGMNDKDQPDVRTGSVGQQIEVDSFRYQNSIPMAVADDEDQPFESTTEPEPMLQDAQPYSGRLMPMPTAPRLRFASPEGTSDQSGLGTYRPVDAINGDNAVRGMENVEGMEGMMYGGGMGGMGGMMVADGAGGELYGGEMYGGGEMGWIYNPDGDAIDKGRGPGMAGDRFEPITDNPFRRVSEHPLNTFSIDVDTASYSKVRSFLSRSGRLPRPDAVRIEEMVNYFDYAYEPPATDSEHPLVARAEIVSCPWNPAHRLARIAIKGKTFAADQRPVCNLVFLIDTSGSMNAPNRLPLVQAGMKLLLSKLGSKDRVAIIVYAGSAGLVLESTPASADTKIRRALTQLSAGGRTNGGAGIALAYQTARDHFIKDGVNRVILCTDGDFNVGTTGTDSLVRMLEEEAKSGVFLTVLGFGMGNHNDAMLEQISGKGNGTYAYIDTIQEARKVLVDQIDSTLVTIAKDVKLQLEFNPARVAAYRLIGYENRVLAKEDFNDDKKDAGEIGAGHAVTALYEIVPVGLQADAIAPPTDGLKYQKEVSLTEAADSKEVLTLKMRYKQPDGDTSKLVEFPVVDEGQAFDQADVDVRFAAAVAGFGMKLRTSPYAGNWTYSDIEKTAETALGDDRFGLRAEFLDLVRRAAMLTIEER